MVLNKEVDGTSLHSPLITVIGTIH